MTGNEVRITIRNRSAADVRGSKRRVTISQVPDPASGCQGLTSRCSVTPGECSSGGRSFAALICRLMVGRSTPRCTYTRQGYAPAPQRAPRLWSARTPLRGAKLSRIQSASPEHVLIHFVPAAFSGMCCRNSVARFDAFCFRPPTSHDAMDFVDSALQQLPAHGSERQIRRAAAAGAKSSEKTQDAAVSVDARLTGVVRTRTRPRGRDSRRHTAGLHRACRAIVDRGQARACEWSEPHSTGQCITGMFRAAALKAVRSVPATPQEFLANAASFPDLRTLSIHHDSMNHGELRNV
jgi:hypothetical protein